MADQRLLALRKKRLQTFLICICLFAIFMTTLYQLGAMNAQLYNGVWHNALRLLKEFFPLDFTRATQWWLPAIDTASMAIAGTMLAVCCALPISILASRSYSPHFIISISMRILLHGLRSIPDFVWLVFLCVAFSAGPFAGMLALALHSIGALGKLFSEQMEHVTPEPVMAIRSTGAHNFQIISHGVLPQLQAIFCDLALYRLEVNIRTAIVLGFIGAGGLGQELLGAMRILAYQEVAAQLLLLIIVVGIIDIATHAIRKKVLRR